MREVKDVDNPGNNSSEQLFSLINLVYDFISDLECERKGWHFPIIIFKNYTIKMKENQGLILADQGIDPD